MTNDRDFLRRDALLLAWNLDGSRLLLTSTRPGKARNWLLTPDGGRWVPSAEEAAWVYWSVVDNDRVIYEDNRSHIFESDVATGETRQLWDLSQGPGEQKLFRPRHDWKKLVVRQMRIPVGQTTHSFALVMNADGTGAIQRIDLGTEAGQVLVSQAGGPLLHLQPGGQQRGARAVDVWRCSARRAPSSRSRSPMTRAMCPMGSTHFATRADVELETQRFLHHASPRAYSCSPSSTMKYLLLAFLCALSLAANAQLPIKEPTKISTTADFHDYLLTHKWSWRNVSAGVPDRECVFMADGTFRHPHFTARFTIKDIRTVELNRKGGERAVMTFAPDYGSFEALDFDKARRITGERMAQKQAP